MLERINEHFNLTPSLNFRFEYSTPLLHMERGGGVLDLRSDEGVRLKCYLYVK